MFKPHNPGLLLLEEELKGRTQKSDGAGKLCVHGGITRDPPLPNLWCPGWDVLGNAEWKPKAGVEMC